MSVASVMKWEPRRDGWGRPKIEVPGQEKPVAYTRASTLAKALDKGEALTKWKQRTTALGLAQRPDLVAMVASHKEDKKALDAACEDALVAAQAQLGANLGTALHAFTEQIDAGDDPAIPAELQADIEAYKQTTAGLTMLSSEQFVVQDEIRCAGTYDRLVQVDGQVYVADIKTGQHEPRYPHSAAIQCAVYARGTAYGKNGRASNSLAQAGVNQDRALLIWLPSRQGKCELYWLDVATGWQMARVATGVRKWHSSKPISAFDA